MFDEKRSLGYCDDARGCCDKRRDNARIILRLEGFQFVNGSCDLLWENKLGELTIILPEGEIRIFQGESLNRTFSMIELNCEDYKPESEENSHEAQKG